MMGENELYELRKQLEEELQDVEKKIYDLETFYLEETAMTGNVINGWANYPTKPISKSHSLNLNKKIKISAKERIFSTSSTTSSANRELEEELNRNAMEPTPGKPSYLGKRKPVRNKNHYSLRNQSKDYLSYEGYGYENSDIESPRKSRKKNKLKKKNSKTKSKSKLKKNDK